MNVVCPCCGRKLLSHASSVCNWCGYRIDDPDFQENAKHERDLFFQHAEEHEQASVQKMQMMNINSGVSNSYHRYGVWMGDIRSPSNTCLTIAVLCFVFCLMRGIPAVNALRTEGINGYVIVDGGRQVTHSPVKKELEYAGLLFFGSLIAGVAAIRIKE